jgi:hypothetical protein
MQASEQALSLARWCGEVYGHDASIRLDDSAHLPRALLADWPRKVMQHQRTENDVEGSVGEWKPLDERRLKLDLDAGFEGLSLCPFNHLRGRIDTDDSARCTNSPLRREGKRPRSATHVQHRLARLQPGELRQPLAERAISAECQ